MTPGLPLQAASTDMLTHCTSFCLSDLLLSSWPQPNKTVDRKLSDKHRGSSTARGYGYKWQQASKGFLRKHNYCLRCESEGIVTRATVVDHRVPPRLAEANESGIESRIEEAFKLFWDRDNWDELCKPCHDNKTATEDGGFGRRGGG